MDRTNILLLFFSCWIACCVGDPALGPIKEHGTITLTYNSTGATTPRDKYWYKGYYNTSHLPTRDKLVYQFQVKWTPGPAVRPGDMSLSGDELVINKVQLEDDGYFTCKTQDVSGTPIDVYNRAAHLQVYIQPEVTITTFGESVAGKDLTVTCTVDRLYPKLTDGNFVMKWEGRDITDVPTSKENGPPAIKYTITTTQTLHNQDDRKNISCTITPNAGFGEVRTNSTILDVQSAPNDVGKWVGIGIALSVIAVACVVAGLLVCSHKATCCWSKKKCPSCSNCHSGGCCSRDKFRCPCCEEG